MKKIIYTLSLILFITLSFLIYPHYNEVLAAVPAFPGAEGFGSETAGGRGGKVIEVTNLNDSGTGSLRACIEASGSRICVFRVVGTIPIKSKLIISNPYITIAGQTAPGGGITLKNDPSFRKYTFQIDTHDVIIRYVRIRPGPSNPALAGTGETLRAATMFSSNSYNIIFDHCSISWATDEQISTWYAAHDVTVQWSIISESPNCSSHYESGFICHSKGPVSGSEGGYNNSWHHNLMAHNIARNPMIKITGMVDVVNNVVYLSRGSAVEVRGTYGKAPINFINNYYKQSLNSSASDYYIFMSEGGGSVYVKGNIGPSRESNSLDEKLAVDPDDRGYLISSRHTGAPPVTTYSCNSISDCEAYDRVLEGVGAYRGLNSNGTFFDRRDIVDQRILYEVEHGTGSIIDAPWISRCFGKCTVCGNQCCDPYKCLTAQDYEAAGITNAASKLDNDGYPILDPGTAYTDSDHDGMSDTWELNWFGSLSRGSSSNSSSDYDNDGYTDLEEFLNGTNPKGTSLTPSPTNPVSVPGDANDDGRVTIADYIIWLNHYGMSTSNGPKDGDFDNSGSVGIADYIIWLNNYGT